MKKINRRSSGLAAELARRNISNKQLATELELSAASVLNKIYVSKKHAAKQFANCSIYANLANYLTSSFCLYNKFNRSQLFEDITAKKYSAVIIESTKKLSKNRKKLYKLAKHCNDHNVVLLTAEDVLVTASEENDKKFLTLTVRI